MQPGMCYPWNIKVKVKVKSFSCVRLLGTPWTAAYQAPPSMGFSRQEYWSGVHCLGISAARPILTVGWKPQKNGPGSFEVDSHLAWLMSWVMGPLVEEAG